MREKKGETHTVRESEEVSDDGTKYRKAFIQRGSKQLGVKGSERDTIEMKYRYRMVCFFLLKNNNW